MSQKPEDSLGVDCEVTSASAGDGPSGARCVSSFNSGYHCMVHLFILKHFLVQRKQTAHQREI